MAKEWSRVQSLVGETRVLKRKIKYTKRYQASPFNPGIRGRGGWIGQVDKAV